MEKKEKVVRKREDNLHMPLPSTYIPERNCPIVVIVANVDTQFVIISSDIIHTSFKKLSRSIIKNWVPAVSIP
jgi:hypothetical protein